MAMLCALNDLIGSDDCANHGGIKVLYWAKASEIDWVTTAATPAQWDAPTQIISGFTMIGGAVWYKITPERKGSFYTQSFTADADTYAVAINVLFKGKGSALRNALCAAISCCKLVFYVIDNNGLERLFGMDWDGTVFEIGTEPLKITQHDDNSGDKGGDQPSDLVIFGGETDCSAIYGDITQAVFEATYL